MKTKRSGRFLSLALACVLMLCAVALPSRSASAVEADGAFSYSSQLDANQQKLYDTLAGLTGSSDAGEITVRLPNPIVYTADANGENKNADIKFAKIGQGALDALLYDDPSIVWIDKSKCTTSGSARVTETNGGVYTWEINKLTMNVVAEPNSAAMKQQLEAALFTPAGVTRYEKVTEIHDKLCEMIVYEDTENARSPYGALVEGAAVCEGYAKAFKILCERAGIPAVIVAGHGVTSKTGPEGENHMWNYVRMEDGLWYAADVTWGDQKDSISRDFFLVGAGTVSTKAFGSTSFADSHLPDGDFSRGGVVFEYPELSQKMYQPQQ